VCSLDKISEKLSITNHYLEKQGKISIAVDWLQIFGHCTKIPKDTISFQNLDFGNVVLQNNGNKSQNFLNVFDIYLNGEVEKVAVLEAFPNKPQIH
jgi:hypothetical protein